MVNNDSGMIDRTQKTENGCQAKGCALYSSGNGDAGEMFGKKNDRRRFVELKDSSEGND